MNEHDKALTRGQNNTVIELTKEARKLQRLKERREFKQRNNLPAKAAKK